MSVTIIRSPKVNTCTFPGMPLEIIKPVASQELYIDMTDGSRRKLNFCALVTEGEHLHSTRMPLEIIKPVASQELYIDTTDGSRRKLNFCALVTEGEHLHKNLIFCGSPSLYIYIYI